MKNIFHAAAVVALCSALLPAFAQPGASSMGAVSRPAISARMAKLFGDNPGFSATLESTTKTERSETITLPGRIAFDSGKSRFEMNIADAKGLKMSPSDVEQMKTMGMDRMIMISRPDKKVSYTIYPGFNAYIETTLKDSDASKPDSAFKIKTTELGRETVENHACVKNKVVVTDDDGKDHESTVWNATDLKNFPIKIESNEQGDSSTTVFKDIKLSKPESSQFDPPSDFTKYDSMQPMIQAEMMKRMGRGLPGTRPPGL